ncbi:GDP-fucose protein O-fucosyltransferase-domain-containing protein [Ephemerocybe angulata]|uniref:GDP-fucose protein O-fucosyltransferase-domain-containing protein n=1 Tax=Ephemerocybe angulata TaxID=980116 RepID=A0A8H6I7P1_9AGAR|nr:GDP-fucose protein O-fucosyltransferase-domain-containing protein [Tulosesus angulatus]
MSSLFPNKHPRRADASPSISLERGGYRMRSTRTTGPIPRLELPGTPMPHRPRQPAGYRWNFSLTVLLAFLSISCLTCFAFAYYLFTSRWELISWDKHADLRVDRHPQATAPRPHNTTPPGLLPGHKYLAYLPHSGFNNQRIALENAMTLARLLNRSLLVPPVRFGAKPIRYLPFTTLDHSLRLAASDGLEHCGDIPPYLTLPVDCLDHSDSTLVSWNTLFNMSQIEKEQNLIHLDSLSPIRYLDTLTSQPDGVLQLRDESPYNFRFEDGAHSSLSKYIESIPIEQLSDIQHPVLQFGSLFGTTRLALGVQGSAALLRIRRMMVLENPTLNAIVDAIVLRLGGNSYIGLHLRIGDGTFYDRKEITIQESWRFLLQRAGCSDLEIEESAMQNPLLSQSWSQSQHIRHSSPSLCALSTPIFISTDSKNPRTDPILLPFRQAFPSVRFLMDFQDQLKPLRAVVNTDGVRLSNYLEPLVDAMIVARADSVVGTLGSTFSKFIIEILRPAYQSNRIYI